jgi:integrase
MGRKDFTVHGMRSTFKNWSIKNRYQWEVTEIALSHRVGDETERAYFTDKMIEERRAMMEQWARYCSEPEGSNVVALRA